MVTELCQCCGTDNSTRMVTSTDMPQHNKLLSTPTVAQGSLIAQLPWASLAPPVIHSGWQGQKKKVQLCTQLSSDHFPA